MKLLLSVSTVMLFSAVNVNAFDLFGSKDTVDQYRAEAKQDRYNEYVNAPDICKILSDDACSLLVKKPVFEIDDPELDKDDRLIVSELLSITAATSANNAEAIPDARKTILRMSALTLGIQFGMAVEGARYNRLWANYASIYDKAIDFESLLISSPSGRNIIPPVIEIIGDSRQIGSGGRVFRFSDMVYRVSKQPRFMIIPPRWRDYLSFEIVRPTQPAAGVLPSSAEEVHYWRTQAVRGYNQGIKTTREKVQAKYRSMVADYLGMVNYHLLREFNMISEPKIEMAHNPILANHDGSMMTVDDSIAVLSVDPILNADRKSWAVYPQIKKMQAIHKEYMDSFEAFLP